MYKRIVLIIIITLEFFIGTIFIYNFYTNKINEEEKYALKKVTRINKDTVSVNPEEKILSYWEYLPGEWIDSPNNIAPHDLAYYINGDGLRENTDYSIEKSKKTYRIMTLGDSLTFGLHVDIENIWPEKLEQSLLFYKNNCGYEKFEVINMGISGFDVGGIVRRYGEIGKKYNPDLIIWLESGSGFYRHSSLISSIANECMENTSVYKTEEDKQKQCVFEAQNQIIENYSPEELFNLAKKHYEKYFAMSSTESTIIFYINSIEEEYSDQINDFRNTYPSTPFLPIAKNITKEGMLPDGHPSKIGHKIIAESIFDYLKEENIICN